jgi:hypothetical protein
MTLYQISRISPYGQVTSETVEAWDWAQLFSTYQHRGYPIFKAEVVGMKEPPKRFVIPSDGAQK